MTREEREQAIAILENEKKCVNRANKNDYCNRDCYNCELVKTDTEILTALDMAIKALEQEPCEDAVSRQAVLDYIYNDLGLGDEENGKDLERQMELESSYRYVKSLPSVKPQEPKTGHWIEKDGYDGDTYYDCSVCDESWTTIEGTPWNNGMKYCPNCGAKMVEEHESEDKE